MTMIERAVVGLPRTTFIVRFCRIGRGLLADSRTKAILDMDDALLDAADLGEGGRHEGHGEQQGRRGANDRVPDPREDHVGVPTR